MNAMSPEDIARRVGVTGLRVRGVLRAMYPRQAPGKGGRWDLSSEQVESVLAYFAGRRPSSSSSPPRKTLVARDAAPTDWFWEGNVQRVVVSHLRREGWIVTAEADTAARATGPDIAARKGGRELVVEVKGYPSIGYRDPRRAHEVKRTNPTLQAKHWYADALLKVVRHRGTQPKIDVAIALPDFARYQSLVAETRGALKQLGVGLFVISERGTVTEVLALPRR